MSSPTTIDLTSVIELDRIDPTFPMPFNHRIVDDQIFIANDFGDFAFLNVSEFKLFLEGDLEPEDDLYTHLAERNFIAAEVDIGEQAARFARRKHFLSQGPVLHGMVLTDRCNHGCQYCHSSVVGMSRFDTDMSTEVAEKAVDMAFQTSAFGLTIEFQGGEPTANWETLSHIVTYAQKKNLTVKKDLAFSLVTNFSLMDEERMNWLIENRVQVCTSLDGPEDLHNKIRRFKDGNPHALATHWIRRSNERYAEIGLDPSLYRVEALPTITRDSLSRARDIVDEYVSLGCRALFLRKLDPYGFAAQSHVKLGYSMDDFLKFYEEALDYIIELNHQGVEIMERHAAIMLCKMIGDFDPNYLDLRTPGGAVIGQLAYHPDGRVYTSDEGRMVASMGDDIFCIGNVLTDTYDDLMNHPTSQALVLAGTNDAQPDCAHCVYKTYCGQQPEYNYTTQGSFFGRMRDSVWCSKHKNIFDYLARRLKNNDPKDMAMFDRWTTNRAQEHFLQDVDE